MDEGLGEGKSVKDTEDLGDDDAEDVTEDDDKLGNADVDVAAVAACGHGGVLLPLSLLRPRFLVPVPDQWKLRIRMMPNDKMLVYKWQCPTEWL